MSTQHTPGPWHHHAKLTASENHRGFSIRAARWSVADVQPIDVDGKEGEANARLIAAAPLLLEALQKAQEELRCGNVNSAAERIAHALERTGSPR